MALYDCFKCDEVKYPKDVFTYADRSDRDPITSCKACGRKVSKREVRVIDLTKPMVVMQSVDCRDLEPDEIPF